MKKGFTLAEVLITLGIIGIMASLTLPAVIGHYKKVETASRLKKFYSSIQQAIVMSEAVNGEVSSWIKPASSSDYDMQGKVSKEFFLKYLAPYFKYVEIIDGRSIIQEDGTKSGTETRIFLADGSSFSLNNGGCMDVIFDSNGNKLPNTFAKDQFTFYFCFAENEKLNRCGSSKKTFCTAKNGVLTRDEALNKCKRIPYYCTGLLEYDNWEFKDDYPYKL